MHVAELLAGIPWTESRVRHHVVNEVAQTLHKVLVFTNPFAQPSQKWKQGCSIASWAGDSEGEHTCTLYISVPVQENKVKPRKGQNFGWNWVPIEIRERINQHTTNTIEEIDRDRLPWQKMIGNPVGINQIHRDEADTLHNRFSILSKEEALTTLE